MSRSACGGAVLAAVLGCLSACSEGTTGGSGGAEQLLLTGRKGSVDASSSALVALAASQPSTFALLARDSIAVREDARVWGGDVSVSRNAGPPLVPHQVAAVEVEERAEVAVAHRITAKSVLLKRRSVVGDLSTDKLVNRGGTHGTETPFAEVAAAPSTTHAAPGAETFTASRGTERAICPGSYGEVIVKHGATLRLIGGAYDLLSLRLHAGSRIEVLGPVMVRIAGKLDAHERSYLGPASGSGLTAKDVRVAVLGGSVHRTRDEDDGDRDDDGYDRHPGGAAAALGARSEVRALMAVPDGVLVMGPKLKATGAFFAAGIDIRSHALVTFEDGFAAWDSALPPVCDDGNACTSDTCSVGACRHAPTPTGSSCSDGNACNGIETCDGSGVCRPGAPPVVDDGNPCTTDSCDPVLGVRHPPLQAGTSCSDGNACDGEEVCGSNGVCLAGTPPVVDDGNPCTADSCHPLVGAFHVPMSAGASCSDGNACNGIELCDGAGVCLAGIPPVLDDGNVCTADSCDPMFGIRHDPAPAETPCSDGNVCNGQESCDGAAACVAGTPSVLDDGNSCTADSCDPARGVVHTPIPTCAAVRGRVKGRDGSPISSVAVTVPNHTEFGTLTRGDGTFDLAVSGGESFTVSYQKDGYPPVHRQVQAPATGNVNADEVVLTAYDIQVTPVVQDASATQVVRGSPMADSRGRRQATILFSPGTQASMVMLDATSQPLSSTFHVRATEYTVGSDWLAAMPAAPPLSSSYTYAVELSLDEAVTAGASSVQFSQPVTLYVEDFLGFPAGSALSVGYYDRGQSAWVAESSGRAVVVMSVNGGQADLDVDGDGLVDGHEKLAVLDITDGERQQLASLYQPGVALWRISLAHFTPVAIGRFQLGPCSGAAGSSCSDGDACNGLETCDGVGHCLAGVPPVEDDGNTCTIDTCDPVLGVLHGLAPVGASCWSGNVCIGLETCDGAGQCQPGTPLVIDDGDPCTVDSCDALLGVQHLALPPGSCPAGSPPSLTVAQPRQGFVVASDLLQVAGTVTGGTPPLTAMVNGTAVYLASDGSFSILASVALGSTSIVVRVTDGTGATAQQVVSGQRGAGSSTGSGAVGGISTVGGACSPKTGFAFTYDPAGHLTGIFNTASDASNCGCVGYVCGQPANAPPVCSSGTCGAVSAGQFLNVWTDPANCGGVGTSCPSTANGTTSCGSGSCGVACLPGFAAASGHCVDPTSDPRYCGGAVCPGAEDGTATCTFSVCGTIGIPSADSVNAISAPGLQFKAPLWSGITIEGSSLEKVTYIDLEDWNPDTAAGVPDSPSAPVPTGLVLPGPGGPPVAFTATGSRLSIPAAALQYEARASGLRWREWYKLRLHYTDGNGIDRYVVADVAVSLDNQAPVALPPPHIASVSRAAANRVFGPYDPTTGFLPIVVDPDNPSDGVPTMWTPPPTSVLAFDRLASEYPLVAATNDGVYIASGLDPRPLSNGAAAVFPYTNARGDVVHLGGLETLCYAYGSCELMIVYSGDRVILRGSNLVEDGPIVIANPIGTVQGYVGDEGGPIFSGDRIVITDSRAWLPAAYIEFDSARGAVATPWPMNWQGRPRIGSVEPGYVHLDAVMTIVGTWFLNVRSVQFTSEIDLSSRTAPEELTMAVSAPPGAGQYYPLDDKHIQIVLASQGGSVERGLEWDCRWSSPYQERFPGKRLLRVTTSEATTQWIRLPALDPASSPPPAGPAPCVAPLPPPPPPPPGPPQPSPPVLDDPGPTSPPVPGPGMCDQSNSVGCPG